MSLSLSIITPCLNRVQNIECSIQSVLKQGYPDVEHIIVDGGSTDGTLEILSQYPHLKVISERDRGMYDALNKGLQLASGKIVGFLNTDDLYADAVLQQVMEYFTDEQLDAVSGRAQIFKAEEDGRRQTVLELPPPHPARLLQTAITGSTIFNAWFYRKSLIERVGGFDPQFKISGDADLILRLALMGINYRALKSVHYLYRHHADSLTFDINSAKLLKIFRDHALFIKKHMSSAEMPNDAKALLNVLHTNTCMSLARQYQSEGKGWRSLLWKFRASLNITLPIARRLAL